MIGVTLAIVASVCLNVGKGVQKWKLPVLAQGRGVLDPEHRRNFALWLVGVGMTSAASVLYSLALKFTDKASTVTALNGVGLIGLVIFAWLVLGERVGARELAGAALVMLGTGIMGVLDEPAPAGQTFALRGLVISCAVAVGMFVPVLVVVWRTRKLHGLTFGAAAGTLLAVAMILGDVALVDAGDDFFGQLGRPYVYVALLTGTGALGMTQLAFWRATAMVVVPTVNSMMIIAPLPLQFMIFGTVLTAGQYVGIAVIVGGVVLLTTGTASNELADE